jgi:hypothetical protein
MSVKHGGKLAATPSFFDHFDDAAIGIDTFLGNGTISETGSELEFDAPNSVSCQWFTTTQLAPLAFVGLPIGPFFRIETRMPGFSRTTNSTIAGIFVSAKEAVKGVVSPSTSNGLYYVTFYPAENRVICDLNASSRLFNGPAGADPNTTPHRYRIYVNRSERSYAVEAGTQVAKNTISFWVSVDDGATYTLLGNRTLDFTPELAGVFLRKWATGGGDNAQAEFDYLETLELERISGPPDVQKGGFESRGTLPTAGGAPDHRRHDGIGAGQIVPGPASTQNEDSTTRRNDPGGFEDAHELVDPGGPELHRNPDLLPGGR